MKENTTDLQALQKKSNLLNHVIGLLNDGHIEAFEAVLTTTDFGQQIWTDFDFAVGSNKNTKDKEEYSLNALSVCLLELEGVKMAEYLIECLEQGNAPKDMNIPEYITKGSTLELAQRVNSPLLDRLEALAQPKENSASDQVGNGRGVSDHSSLTP